MERCQAPFPLALGLQPGAVTSVASGLTIWERWSLALGFRMASHCSPVPVTSAATNQDAFLRTSRLCVSRFRHRAP
jgi:hypothetical protein